MVVLGVAELVVPGAPEAVELVVPGAPEVAGLATPGIAPGVVATRGGVVGLTGRPGVAVANDEGEFANEGIGGRAGLAAPPRTGPPTTGRAGLIGSLIGVVGLFAAEALGLLAGALVRPLAEAWKLEATEAATGEAGWTGRGGTGVGAGEAGLGEIGEVEGTGVGGAETGVG